MSKLYVITGPAGVGKSTISNLVADRLEKSAIIEGDEIYHMVKSGYVAAWKEGNQLELFWQNVISLISNFIINGYDVVFNYIVNKESIARIAEAMKQINDCKIEFIVLMADKKTMVERDNLRPEDCRMGERSLILLESFKKQNFSKKHILNTTNLSAEETVDIIMECDFLV